MTIIKPTKHILTEKERMAALKSLAHVPSMLHGSYYGGLDIESPADEFIKYFTRKKEWKCYNHDSFSFYAGK